jgi:1A family penicillin-binding protein
MQRAFKVSVLALILLVVLAAALLALAVAGLADLPETKVPLTSTFFDRDGQVVATRFEQNRFAVTLDQVPPALAAAFIAVEDHRFYRHFGLDVQALLRALWRNLLAGRLAEGGSTITQQLARNLFLTPDKTLSRKLQEAMLAVQLERRFTKDEILEKYLNTIYFGHAAYGVEAASRTYFGKPVQELTLAEAAMLAGIPRGPALYSPFLDFTAAKARQEVVLSRMSEEGFISEAEKDTALAAKLVLRDRSPGIGNVQYGAYFIDYLIERELAAIFPEDPQIVYRGGLQVHTTLDREMQHAAEEAVKTLLPVLGGEQGVQQPQVALVAIDPRDGGIRALIGGRDFRQSQFNRAIPPAGARRSPGSAFKPFVFAAALEAGFTPANVRVSEPVSYTIPGQAEPYMPGEYGGEFFGPLIMRRALARSSNIVAIKTHMEIGPQRAVEVAGRLGIGSPLLAVPSLPLGTSHVTPLEMAAAYAAFANLGLRVQPLFITRITDSTGRLLYENRPRLSAVLDARIAYLLTNMLRDVLAPGGTGSFLGPLVNRPAAAKTGTSEDHRDAYIVGYTPELVAAVWVGNDNNSTLGRGQTGGRLAGPVWANFMRHALQDVPAGDFARPHGLEEALICPETGLLHNPLCAVTPVQELFLAGTAPREQCRWPLCPHCPPQWQWDWYWGQ